MTSSASRSIEKDIGDVIQSTTLFEWSIKNFSKRCKKVGDLILSPVFPDGCNTEFSWRLESYPYGTNKKSIGYLSLFLRNRSLYNVETSFVLSIVNMYNPDTMIKLEHTFTPGESDWGFFKFMDRNKVIENIKSSNDVLTIKCKIFRVKIVNQFKNSPICNTKVDAIINTLGDIGQLYDNKNLSDAILRVDKKEFKVHKAILSARSEVFAAMFEHDMIEKRENVVEIKDINSEIMDAILKFMYTGKVENIQGIAKELLVAADRYAIKDLMDICIIKIGQIINVDNAVDFLMYAESYNFCELKSNIIDYIVNNDKEIMGSTRFESMKNIPSETIINIFGKIVSKFSSQMR